MSIKGTTDQLYVGKKEANIVKLFGNKKTIDYKGLKRIDYMCSSGTEIGFLNFIKHDNKILRFEFSKNANEKIIRAINLIKENTQDIETIEYQVENLKFYQRNLFTIIISFISGFPLGIIGLYLMWHYKKSHITGRLLVTFMAVLLWSTVGYVSYLNHVNAMNDISDVYNQTYGSIIDQANAPVNDIERTSTVVGNTESFTTTFTTGHYLVGTDIPVGTYNFYSKKGTGNFMSSDGTVNVIFDYNKESGKSIGLESLSTEELNNIHLEDGVILTITGNQEISAGCDDGLVDSMVKRNQEGLEELEIGYGNYGASDNIPAGTYDVEWIEGMGNIICTSSTNHGINEIMGEYSSTSEFDKTCIKKFRNLTLNDGDILEIDKLKVKLTPSK